METKTRLVYLLVSLSILFSFSLALLSENDHKTDEQNPTSTDLKTYVVHLKKPSTTSIEALSGDLSSWYQSFLPSTTTTTTTTSTTSNVPRQHPRMVHEYQHVATGFAARLTAAEAAEMGAKEGFLSAKEQKFLSLHTTHTPNFLGLFQGLGLWNDSNLGQGVIIGVLDSGIWPDRPSFDDEGVPPPPPKWKGKCNFNGTVCNKKLIGAKNFVTTSGAASPGDQPPFDLIGHGTHTSSTAAGNFVRGASVFGQANGTASGMAPYAHLAMYRVCDQLSCAEADILAAMDAAVEDGVDVLSLSLGGDSAPFYNDSIAIGAFSAISKGIFVSCSASNTGPDYGTLSNEAPWILTVGASTIDRKIKAVAKLGDGEELEGESLFQTADLAAAQLVYAGESGNQSAALCSPGTLDKLDVKGKVVACDRGRNIARIDKGKVVKNAGGVGMILMNLKQDGFSTLADRHVLPATHISFAASLKLKSYVKSSPNPTAGIIFKGTVIGDSRAPAVSSFSSRGPSLASTGILKPDIIGPGVSILAAWPFSVDNATTAAPTATFNMLSGTSMSCPHLAGIAALLRSAHPEWSPAAVKSAIMTTADVLNLAGRPILNEKASAADVFAIGSGHVNPPKANNPGLIYDIEPQDYIPYLCGLNYTDDQVSTITQTQVKCSEVKAIPEAQLNYPTFSIILGSESQYYTRTVTNVGEANSVYTLDLSVPAGLGMSVNPSTLTFTEVNQKIEFQVEFIPQVSHGTSLPFSQGYLRWVSDNYSVRSQISVIFDS